MAPRSASLVLPVYNGERYLADTFGALLEFFAPRRPLDIVVVNDGSRDSTAAIVRQWASTHPQIRLLQHASNRGKGAAVRTGVLASGGALIGFCDVDLPVPVEHIEQLFRTLEEGAEIVIASRALSQSVLVVPPSALRHLLSRSFNRIVRALFALPFHDTQCGLKGFRQAAAREVFSQALVDGFAFDVELLLLARELGYEMVEMAARFDNPRQSSIRLEAHAATICRDLWRMHRRLRHMRGAGKRRKIVPDVEPEERAVIGTSMQRDG